MELAMIKTTVILLFSHRKEWRHAATAYERQDQIGQPTAFRAAAIASSDRFVSIIQATDPHLDARDVSQASPTQQDRCQRCVDEQGQDHDA